MSKKHKKVNEAMQTKADDFKLINGITGRIEKRLHAADIQTYAQLALLSQQEILSKLGKGKDYSIRRIKDENWLGQARGLIPKEVAHRPRKKETAGLSIRQHYENFTIEFLLDEKNLVRRIHVMHIQSEDADTWAGWKVEQLFEFLARHIGVRLPDTKSAYPAAFEPDMPRPPSTLTEQTSKATSSGPLITPIEISEKNTDELPSLAVSSKSMLQIVASADTPAAATALQQQSSTLATTRSIEKITLLELKISLPDTDQSRRNLPQDQAFDLSLTLDLSHVSLSETSQLIYTATVHAKKLGGRNRQLIGQIQKTVPFNHVLLLTIRCAPLSQGIYRLEALVTIGLTGMEVGQRQNLMSFLESGPLQVY